jgi:hypothetical protein
MVDDWIAGDVVLTGPLDDDGKHLSVPDEVYV